MNNSESDPFQTSLIGVKKEDLIHKGITEESRLDIVEDDEGRTFYGGKKFREGPNQMMLTRMLKSIIPVSDVVFAKDKTGRGNFYSYKTPLEDVNDASESPYTLEEAKVDQTILMCIFNDYDHSPYEDEGESVNTVFSKGKHAFFDFDQFSDFWINKVKNVSSEVFYRNIVEDMNDSQISFMLKRLDELQTRFEGEEGLLFLNSIVKSIPLKGYRLSVIDNAPGEDKVKSFQEELIHRLKDFRSILSSNDISHLQDE